MTKNIFSITIIQDGDTITAHADYTGESCAAHALGVDLMSQLAGIDSSSESLFVSPLLRAAWVQ